jgi:reactive intermediate/imine deaminase
MPQKEIVSSEHTPKAIGPYSPAVRSGELLFTSGQLGMDPATGGLVAGGVTAETRLALQHCTRLLEAAGGTLQDVLKTTVFLRSMEDFRVRGFFPARPPRPDDRPGRRASERRRRGNRMRRAHPCAEETGPASEMTIKAFPNYSSDARRNS